MQATLVLSDTNHFHFCNTFILEMPMKKSIPNTGELGLTQITPKWPLVFLKTFSPCGSHLAKSKLLKMWFHLTFLTNCRTFIEIHWFQPDWHSGDILAVRIEFPGMNFTILGSEVFSLPHLYWISTKYSVQPMEMKDFFKNQSQSFRHHPIVYNLPAKGESNSNC